MKDLKDLPNVQGFEFIGITILDGRIPCYIHNSLDSGHIVLTKHTNVRIYDRLKGWDNAEKCES